MRGGVEERVSGAGGGGVQLFKQIQGSSLRHAMCNKICCKALPHPQNISAGSTRGVCIVTPAQVAYGAA